jgi:3-oxoacyl-[acyl-carrier-protein] synthase III
MIYSIITGTGSCIPEHVQTNNDFLKNSFFESSGKEIDRPNEEIIEKFKDITTIQNRRYALKEQSTSDLAAKAARNALDDSGIDPETLDYVIVAHNFGEARLESARVDVVPSLAARVKHKLGIKNPNAVAYDIIFGCPGWLQAVIQADYFIRSGEAKKILVVGADSLSRISDPHDRDSMLYADGAGATVLEAYESNAPVGILAHATRSDTFLYSGMLFMGPSYNPEYPDKDKLFIKMNGRRLYQYALDNVPVAIKACLDKRDIPLDQIKKVLIHQANGKMDDAILQRLYSLYQLDVNAEEVMPMTISELGNTSVATVPTLYDLIKKGELKKHSLHSGDLIVFASVGAGMSINALVYKEV